MQYNVWFMLGSAAFRADKWETVDKAFRTCTHLEPDVSLDLYRIYL